MKYVMKAISDESWVLSLDGQRIGLVFKNNDKFDVIGKLDQKTYESIDDLSAKLGKKIHFEEKVSTNKEISFNEIDSFPTKHKEIFNVLKTPIPSYTRTEKSELRYAAGFYAFKFANGWTPSFCPKLSTLIDNEHIGPYTTKIELQHQISAKNKEIVI